jgi:hypothetical protein
MKFVTVRVPEELVARVDRALAREGLEVREFVKNGGYQLEVANRIGGAPGVPRLLAPDGPRMPSPLGMRLRGWA